MSISIVVGVNWGDEGKGRLVDYLAEQADAVIRYQGGNNAGHTVINHLGIFKLHLLPSGIFYPHVQNVLGAGMVIDIESLHAEIKDVTSTASLPLNLHISSHATVVFPFHRMLDAAEEGRLADRPYGSTRRGIAPAYADRYLKKALKIGDLLHMPYARQRTREIVAWANLLLTGVYKQHPVNPDEMVAWMEEYAAPILPLIKDTPVLLDEWVRNGKRLLFEAQLGALRDVDYGIYPYTSSSSCLTANSLVGGSLFNKMPDRVIGVMKAYSTCVGEGPFVTELFGAEAEELRMRGGEFGASTGRPRRVGPFDAVASRYGILLQGATEVALTKLDILSGSSTLKICTAYEVNGVKTTHFPHPSLLSEAKPIYEEVPGWTEDLSGVRSFDQLPKVAQAYVLRVESLIGVPIKSVSVGPEREAMILR